VLTDSMVHEYVADLASNKPAPGGGSAAALTGALGASLGEMVGNFTVGKKKYADVEQEVAATLGRLTALRNMLLRLTDQDAEVYRKVGDAYRMPKETDEQAKQRAQAIEEAVKAAAEVPREVVLCCTSLLTELPVLLEKGNLNLVSDVGVAAKLALTAAQCGWLNVEINLASIKNAEYIHKMRAELKKNLAGAEKLAREK